MTKHIERQIENLKERILRVGTLVEEAISKSITALINHDAALAQRVIANDEEIDRMEVEVEEECLKILALYQPVATDLRFVVAVLKINNDLERMGDLARNIAKRVTQLATGRPSVFFPDGLRTLARRTARAAENEKLLRDLNDLTRPATTGDPIPGSSTQEPARRAAAAAGLIAQGLRFVAVDAALYGPEGLALAKAPFADRIVEERVFDDGTGVVVWVVQ